MTGFNFQGMKAAFFDSDKVLSATSAAERKVLSKQGAFVRQRAKTSIKYRTKTSEPGQPPSARRLDSFTRTTTNRKTGIKKTRATSPLKELIFFAWDAKTRSVVVGPEIFRSAMKPGTAPKALERGGSVEVRNRRGPRMVHVRARPFMGPAEKAERAKFAGRWKGAVKAGT